MKYNFIVIAFIVATNTCETKSVTEDNDGKNKTTCKDGMCIAKTKAILEIQDDVATKSNETSPCDNDVCVPRNVDVNNNDEAKNKKQNLQAPVTLRDKRKILYSYWKDSLPEIGLNKVKGDNETIITTTHKRVAISILNDTEDDEIKDLNKLLQTLREERTQIIVHKLLRKLTQKFAISVGRIFSQNPNIASGKSDISFSESSISDDSNSKEVDSGSDDSDEEHQDIKQEKEHKKGKSKKWSDKKAKNKKNKEKIHILKKGKGMKNNGKKRRDKKDNNNKHIDENFVTGGEISDVFVNEKEDANKGIKGNGGNGDISGAKIISKFIFYMPAICQGCGRTTPETTKPNQLSSKDKSDGLNEGSNSSNPCQYRGESNVNGNNCYTEQGEKIQIVGIRSKRHALDPEDVLHQWMDEANDPEKEKPESQDTAASRPKNGLNPENVMERWVQSAMNNSQFRAHVMGQEDDEEEDDDDDDEDGGGSPVSPPSSPSPDDNDDTRRKRSAPNKFNSAMIDHWFSKHTHHNKTGIGKEHTITLLLQLPLKELSKFNELKSGSKKKVASTSLQKTKVKKSQKNHNDKRRKHKKFRAHVMGQEDDDEDDDDDDDDEDGGGSPVSPPSSPSPNGDERKVLSETYVCFTNDSMKDGDEAVLSMLYFATKINTTPVQVDNFSSQNIVHDNSEDILKELTIDPETSDIIFDENKDLVTTDGEEISGREGESIVLSVINKIKDRTGNVFNTVKANIPYGLQLDGTDNAVRRNLNKRNAEITVSSAVNNTDKSKIEIEQALESISQIKEKKINDEKDRERSRSLVELILSDSEVVQRNSSKINKISDITNNTDNSLNNVILSELQKKSNNDSDDEISNKNSRNLSSILGCRNYIASNSVIDNTTEQSAKDHDDFSKGETRKKGIYDDSDEMTSSQSFNQFEYENDDYSHEIKKKNVFKTPSMKQPKHKLNNFDEFQEESHEVENSRNKHKKIHKSPIRQHNMPNRKELDEESQEHNAPYLQESKTILRPKKDKTKKTGRESIKLKDVKKDYLSKNRQNLETNNIKKNRQPLILTTEDEEENKTYRRPKIVKYTTPPYVPKYKAKVPKPKRILTNKPDIELEESHESSITTRIGKPYKSMKKSDAKLRHNTDEKQISVEKNKYKGTPGKAVNITAHFIQDFKDRVADVNNIREVREKLLDHILDYLVDVIVEKNTERSDNSDIFHRFKNYYDSNHIDRILSKSNIDANDESFNERPPGLIYKTIDNIGRRSRKLTPEELATIKSISFPLNVKPYPKAKPTNQDLITNTNKIQPFKNKLTANEKNHYGKSNGHSKNKRAGKKHVKQKEILNKTNAQQAEIIKNGQSAKGILKNPNANLSILKQKYKSNKASPNKIIANTVKVNPKKIKDSLYENKSGKNFAGDLNYLKKGEDDETGELSKETEIKEKSDNHHTELGENETTVKNLSDETGEGEVSAEIKSEEDIEENYENNEIVKAEINNQNVVNNIISEQNVTEEESNLDKEPEEEEEVKEDNPNEEKEAQENKDEASSEVIGEKDLKELKNKTPKFSNGTEWKRASFRLYLDLYN